MGEQKVRNGVRGNSRKNDMVKRIMEIAKECAPLWKEPHRSMSSAELDDLLYSYVPILAHTDIEPAEL
jgi:phosphoribosyl-ATP pyrophosphohydrolase